MTEPVSQPMIEAQGLTRYFGAFVAIKDVSFSIPRGQVVAFLGPNGAGKSTTMRILSGFLAPSSGRATIGGLDTSAQRLDVARMLGYLPENGPLYDDMTPAELLGFFGQARGLEPQRLAQRIEEVTELADLHEVLEKPIGKLSRGYRQRVGMAQALLHDPDVLIMDEPTAGLDPNQIRDFRTNIGRLAEAKTILISTHILQEVEAVAQRVLVINRGRMVYDGTPDELRGSDTLEQAFHRLTGQADTAAAAESDGGAS